MAILGGCSGMSSATRGTGPRSDLELSVATWGKVTPASLAWFKHLEDTWE